MRIFLISLLLLGACSGSSKKSKTTDVGVPAVVTEANGEKQDNSKTKEDERSVSEGSTLDLLLPAGSAMRFLDARGLQVYYRHIFTPKAFGYMHCEGLKPRMGSDCEESIFNASERASMGSFEMNSPEFGIGTLNVHRAENLSLNYLRTLRSALGRECSSLVKTEMTQLSAGTAAANVLIKAEKPSVESLDAFMRKIFGITDSAIIDVGSKSYVDAFEEAIKDAKDKPSANLNAYVGLCVALSMDPQVFLY